MSKKNSKSSAPPNSVEEKFRRTRFCVTFEASIMVVRVGSLHPLLDQLTKFTSWAILKASNPDAIRYSDEDNCSFNSMLADELNNRGFTIENVQCRDVDRFESSEAAFFVTNADLESCLELARQFDQLALVAGQSHHRAEIIWT